MEHFSLIPTPIGNASCLPASCCPPPHTTPTTRKARQLAQDEDELETLLGKLDRLQSKAVESEESLHELEQVGLNDKC